MKLSHILVGLVLLPFSLFSQHQITGEIVLPNALPICNVLVEVRNDVGDLLGQDLSEVDGTFVLENIPAGTGYTVLFSKEGVPLNGTSTFDLVLLARRILGIDPVQPYDLWIGDVNGSGSMTTIDMIVIRKVILQIETTFLVPTWAFDAPDAMVPDNLIEVPVLDSDVDLEVIGVKRADFNGTAQMTCQ